MKARLIERGASAAETRDIPLNKSEFLIGRGADCDLRLRVTSVSRHHCLIKVGKEETTVMDCGSSNGTFLNDKRVLSQAAMHSGDDLRVGDRRFLVDLGDLQQQDLGSPVESDASAPTVRINDRPGGPKLEKDK